MKIGMNTLYKMDVDEKEQLRIIKEAGFDTTMLSYFVGDNIWEMYDTAIGVGLEVANIHAPISDVNSVWTDSTDGDDYIEIQKERVDFCHSTQIPTLVLHTTFLKDVPPMSEIGITRHKRLGEYAEKKGVRLAFENVEPYPHLDAVLNAVGDFHGFCWDTGHNRAYAPDIDFSKLYGDRLIAVHIHDNFGMGEKGVLNSKDDKHFIPYDGNADWEDFANKIKKTSFNGPLTLEISSANSQDYRDMGMAKVASIAYERICKIRNMF